MGRAERFEHFLAPRKTLKVFLGNAAPDKMEYPFRSHPLGLMYLAAYAERQVPGVKVEILDMKVSESKLVDLQGIVGEEKPDIVGLGGLTVHAGAMHAAAAEARRAAPEAMILAGGPHATCFPGKVLSDENIDAVVLGEGEHAFANILRARREGSPINGIQAVGTAEHLDPDERDVVLDPDELPMPAWDKIDIPAYERHSSFTILGKRKYMGIFSSRACPYSCIYCHNIFGRRFRARGAQSVLSEIRTLMNDYGIRDFDVLDDVFNLKRERLVEICQTIIDEKLDIRIAFANGLRSDLLDEEIIHLLRAAGTTYISFAIETASPRLQKMINKNLKLDRARKAIEAASREGILCNGFFMLGFPTETEEELRQTIDFAVHSPLDIAHFLRVTPFEGTKLFDLVDDETKKYLTGHPEYLCYEDRHLNLSEVPAKRFRSLFRHALMRFYLNPLRMLKILRHHPDRISMLGYVPIALKRILIKG